MLPLPAAWTIAAITIVSRSALSTIVALLLWSVLPNLAGFQTTTVMSGSMEPRMQIGDAIVVRHIDAGQLSDGQVLLFDDPDHPGRLRMHRLIAVQPDGRLVTKGDANAGRDTSTVTADAVHGAAFLRIPYAGLPNYWLLTGQPLPLIAGGALVLLLMGGIRLGRLLEDEEERQRRRHRGIRLRGVHRATAAAVALVVLSAAGSVSIAQASAGYAATTPSGSNTWNTMCGDVQPTFTTVPVLYWGYGSNSGSNIADLSGQSDAGGLIGDAVRATCSGGASPTISVGSGSGGAVVEQPASARAYPGDTTIATWFKTSNPGGTIADFGIAKTGTSYTMDKVLYMRADGNITFGNFTQSLLNLTLGSSYCTTTASGGYADGGWHLVVATYSDTAGCTITVDNGTPVTQGPAYALKALTGFYGYWRFGMDAASAAGWTGATTRNGFIGNLDESQVYSSVLGAPARAAIFTRGH